MTRLAHLRKLSSEATAGPWHVVGPPWNDKTPYVIAEDPDPHVGRFVADLEDYGQGERDDPAQEQADAALIAEARNALDDLLDVVELAESLLCNSEDAEAEIRGSLRAALARFTTEDTR